MREKNKPKKLKTVADLKIKAKITDMMPMISPE